ncbi:MAG: sigma-70 family RNA polymerase sigma factor [Ginsengibacter sp.]
MEFIYVYILFHKYPQPFVNSQKPEDLEDADLLRNFFADHDNKWLGILLPRYTLLLLGVCMKYLRNEEDAKDSVQQVFLKVIGEMHKYKVDYFKSWIYMVAKNHCLMKLRDKNTIFVNLDQEQIPAEDSEDIHLHLEKNKTLNEIEAALLKLSTEQQHCVTLFYLQKKSYSEIAEATGFSLMQVKSHIQNGKRNLRLMLINK